MSLRDQTMRGAAYLLIRQGLGIGLSLVSIMLVTRLIGPVAYGVYATGVGVTAYISSIGAWGLDAYLVRLGVHEPSSKDDQAFTFLVGTASLLTMLIVAFAPFAGMLLKMPEVTAPLRVLALSLPLSLLGIPPLALLGRRLDYNKIAVMELVSQTLYCLVAVTLAVTMRSVWAPIVGLIVQQLTLLVWGFVLTGYRPKMIWNREGLRDIGSYGFGYSASIWVWQLRTLVNPIIVGRFGGPAAVAYIALAIRMADILSFVKAATWRLAMATFGRLGGDVDRIKRAVVEGSRLQVFALGPLFLGFSILAPLILPSVFGAKWDPALRAFPYIAVGYLVNSVFSLHSTALYVLGRNVSVTLFHIVHVSIFALGSWLLVPRYGFVGYGYGEVAALASYFVINYFFRLHVGRGSPIGALVWVAGFALAIFVNLQVGVVAGLVCMLPLAVAAVMPQQRRELVSIWNMVRTRQVRM